MTAATGFSTGAASATVSGTTKVPIVVTSAGQEVFIVPTPPPIPSLVYMSVNGVDYLQPDITVVGTTVTWNGPFKLELTDKVAVIV